MRRQPFSLIFRHSLGMTGLMSGGCQPLDKSPSWHDVEKFHYNTKLYNSVFLISIHFFCIDYAKNKYNSYICIDGVLFT